MLPQVEQAIEFIRSMGLVRGAAAAARADGSDGNGGSGAEARPLPSVKATGGGAFKFAQLFAERLGVALSKEDEVSE